MRVKKCLGCGSIYKGGFSICQKCVELMSALRQEVISIPGRLKKNNLAKTRLILLVISILLIICHVLLLGVVFNTMWFLIFNNITYNRINLFICLYLPLSIAIALGVFTGRLYGRKIAKLSIGQFLSGFWYDRPDRSLSNLKYWLIHSLYLFVWVVLPVFLFVLVRIYMPESSFKNSSLYATLFGVGLFLGIKILFPVFFIGCSLSFWADTSWVKTLTK